MNRQSPKLLTSAVSRTSLPGAVIEPMLMPEAAQNWVLDTCFLPCS